MTIRLIARLDIKGPNLVKGVHLEGLRVLGKPGRFASHYYEAGVDELIFQDVVASLYERNSLKEIIRETASQTFVPLCVGGGLRSLDDIRDVLRAGADKVAINTGVVRDPEFIRRASRRFGSSTIVVAVEAIRQPEGRWEAFTDNGRERTGLDAVAWAQRAADLGAGEILLMSVDQEGTGRGFDVDLVRAVSQRVGIPVIALGGAGRVEHLPEAVRAGADAVACASLFHYAVLPSLDHSDDEFDPGINLTAMRGARTFGAVVPASVPEAREALAAAGVRVRTGVATSEAR